MFIILILYVDDLLLASNCVHMICDTKSFIFKSFEMKDMGDVKYVLDIKSGGDKSNERLGLSQRAYINKVTEI